MTQKIQDTSSHVSRGGRLREYWSRHGMRQRRSVGSVDWNNEIDLNGLIEKYKLCGFEFGRYVSNEDRYDFVVGAKSALKDLAWLLKTENLGINYKIGIAFGARGRGGHAVAHYEPTYNMINLTKNKGDHSLAHEYGHALDFNIGAYVDQNRHHRALSGGRSTAKFPVDNTGGTCRLLMRKLIRDIKTTQSYARLKKASDYWHYNTEVFARYFEQWCCYAIREAGKSDAFLTKAWTTYTTQPMYLTEADFQKVLATGNKLMRNIGLLLAGEKVEEYMELEVTNPEKVKKAAPKAKKTETTKKALPKPSPKKAAAAVAAAKPSKEKPAYQDYKKAFAALAKFTDKDPVKLTLTCVYHDDGNMVATDAHILGVIHKAHYPDKLEHQMVFGRTLKHVTEGSKDVTKQPGDILKDARYPQWRAVIQKKDLDGGTTIVIDDELAKAKKHLEKQRKLQAEYAELKKKDRAAYYSFPEEHGLAGRDSHVYLSYSFKKMHVKADLLVTCLNFMKAAGAKTVFYQGSTTPDRRAGIFRSGNLEALIMPVMIND